MKILFVMYDNGGAQNPIPMGPCYVAGYLKDHGYDDITYYSQDIYHYTEHHLTDYLDTHHYDVLGLGFTAGYYQYAKILRICEAINRSKDKPFLVLGGYGPSPLPEFFLEKTEADAVVVGEGEEALLSIVRSLGRGVVEGLPIKDLDSIPFPYYDPLPMEYYLNQKPFGNMSPTDRTLPMITSRGCPYSCNFCQKQTHNIRYRSAQNVAEELGKYTKDYGVSFSQFWDELFVSSENRTYALTQAISPFNIHYWCTARVNTVNKDILAMLKESGCVYIDYGIEQFDDAALEAMNKKQTEEQIINAIKMTQEAGIKIGFNIIWGNIGDTRESLHKSMNLLSEYNDYGQLRTIRPVTPYPGSPLYDLAIERGLLTGPEDFYQKHRNVELLTCNFTDIPDDEFHECLYYANYE
ncbi:hypothetical protein LCGC14_1632670, partial [marine sediment metagenome]